jgi:hypothetical protein
MFDKFHCCACGKEAQSLYTVKFKSAGINVYEFAICEDCNNDLIAGFGHPGYHINAFPYKELHDQFEAAMRGEGTRIMVDEEVEISMVGDIKEALKGLTFRLVVDDD